MKIRLITAVCGTAILLSSTAPSSASNFAETVADVALVRPVCFALTAAGSAVFVLALPFAALSHSVKQTGELLVVKPARATFSRPVGDLDDLTD